MTLTLRNLCYKKFLKNISLSFSPGKLHGILGPNGSGKSTFLKCLCGIWQPSAGEILWQDHKLQAFSRKELSKTISLVPQNPHSPFDFTVQEIVKMGRYAHGSESSALFLWSLKAADLLHLQNRPLHQLSAGERQRAYIARSLYSEAPIMLLDEPTASLDIRHQLEVWRVLKHQVSRGKIVLVTIHDLATAQHHCDDLTVLHHGHCMAHGTSQEILTPKLLHQVFGVIPTGNINKQAAFLVSEEHDDFDPFSSQLSEISPPKNSFLTEHVSN